jgi:hypothetical protein
VILLCFGHRGRSGAENRIDTVTTVTTVISRKFAQVFWDGARPATVISALDCRQETTVPPKVTVMTVVTLGSPLVLLIVMGRSLLRRSKTVEIPTRRGSAPRGVSDPSARRVVGQAFAFAAGA